MSVALTPELEEFVKNEIASGRYKDENELYHESVRLLQAKERARQSLEREVQLGFDQLDNGQYTFLPDNSALREFFEKLKKEGRQRKNQSNGLPR